MRLRSLVIIVAVGASAIAAPTVLAKRTPPAPPPTLSGTAFAGTPTVTSARCNPARNSVFTYYIAGLSFGTYSGTFEEWGIVIVGPQVGPPPSGSGFPLVAIAAVFTIDSPTGQVRGTKTLPPGSPLAYGICLDTPEGGIRFATAVGLRYTATITTAGGRYRDQGTSNIGSVGSTVPGGAGFSEGFVSSLLEPILLGNGKGKGCEDDDSSDERSADCKR